MAVLHDAELRLGVVGTHQFRVVFVLHPRGVLAALLQHPHRVGVAAAGHGHVQFGQFGELDVLLVRLHDDALHRIFQRRYLSGELARLGVGLDVDVVVLIHAVGVVHARPTVTADARGVALPHAARRGRLRGLALHAVERPAVVVQLQRDGGRADVVLRRAAYYPLVVAEAHA